MGGEQELHRPQGHAALGGPDRPSSSGPNPQQEVCARHRESPPAASSRSADNVTATWRKCAQHNTLSQSRIVTETGSTAPFEDVALNAIRAASERDPDIQALKQAIMNGFPDHKYEVDLQVRPYWSERDKLSVDDNLVICGHRLVVPKGLHKSVLSALVCTRLIKAKVAPREERVSPSTGLE